MSLAQRLRTRTKAASDAPAYRDAADRFQCQNCAFAQPENYCGLYAFTFDPENVCDSWTNKSLNYAQKEVLQQLGWLDAMRREMQYMEAMESVEQKSGNPYQHIPTVIKAAEQLSDQHLLVYKAEDGTRRWIARSSTSFKDKDGQWVTKAALEQAAQKMRETGSFGPLRWWHMGTKGECMPIDIGDCDTSFVYGETLYESGTFRDPIFADVIKADDEISIGFIPLDNNQLDNNEGIAYDAIDIIERSVCPPGTARNLFTGVSIV